MNKKILNYIIFIIIASILLYFARHNYRDFNINKNKSLKSILIIVIGGDGFMLKTLKKNKNSSK